MFRFQFYSALLVTASFPQFVFAADSIQDYLIAITNFINNSVLPVLFSIALLFFFVNITRYFIIDGADTYARDRAKRMALYGILAFVILFSIWGITNLFMRALGIERGVMMCPDYIEQSRDCGTFFNPMPQDLRRWDGFI